MEQLEGRQSILAALKAHQRKFQAILVSTGAHTDKIQEVLDAASARSVPLRYVEARELDAMAHGVTHGGVIAICSAKKKTTPDELLSLLKHAGEPALLLLLEGADDARNLGFTLRSAEALGAHAVLIKKHLWDFDETEIARPASGAYERLPLVQFEGVGLLKELQSRGIRLLGCIANAHKSIYQTDLTGGVILSIGGEKRGLSGAVRSICDELLTIPSKPDPSSLSLSHAAAIVLAEANRQRIAIK